MICSEEVIGLDAASLIPVDFGGTLLTRPRNPSNSVIELGKKLLQSAREGDTQGVMDLMSKGAPFTTDWLGTSPLHLAAMNNHVETCDVLLRAGIGKDSRTKVDRTPLHFAAYEGHVEVARLLLNNDVDVDCRDMLRMTPLHWAVERGHEECVRLLLQKGADPRAESKFSRTPLTIAADMNWLEALQLLQADRTLQATQSIQHTQEHHDIEQTEEELVLVENEEMMQDNQDGKNEMNNMNELENDAMDSEKEAQNALDELLPQVEEANSEATVQLLKEHGITMIPQDNTNTVTSALQSGRNLVLSDAGKLVLKSCKFQKELPKAMEVKKKPIILPTGKIKNTKIYTMSSSQYMAMTGQAKPNILQKLQPVNLKQGGINVIQLPKSRQVFSVSPPKMPPLARNITVSDLMAAQSRSKITMVNKGKGNIVSAQDYMNINQLMPGKTKVIQLKSGSTLGSPVKIVMNKNNLGKFIPSGQIINGVNIMKDNFAAKVSFPMAEKTTNENVNCNVASEVERLKSELLAAKLEAEQYKMKFMEVQNEMQLYKNKVLLNLENNTVEQ